MKESAENKQDSQKTNCPRLIASTIHIQLEPIFLNQAFASKYRQTNQSRYLFDHNFLAITFWAT
jgi:hypothetical protein